MIIHLIQGLTVIQGSIYLLLLSITLVKCKTESLVQQGNLIFTKLITCKCVPVHKDIRGELRRSLSPGEVSNDKIVSLTIYMFFSAEFSLNR